MPLLSNACPMSSNVEYVIEEVTEHLGVHPNANRVGVDASELSNAVTSAIYSRVLSSPIS